MLTYSFDVDAFVVDDKLAAKIRENKNGHRNLASLPEYRGLVNTVSRQIHGIPGVRPDDSFWVRVFTTAEFNSQVGLDERYFVH